MKAFLAAPPDVAVAVRAALEAAGHDVWEPPAAPTRGLAAEASTAFVEEVARLGECDLLVQDVGAPDLAAGWRVAWFLAKGRLVVLACPESAHARLPPLVGANPSPWQRVATYARVEEAGAAVDRALVA